MVPIDRGVWRGTDSAKQGVGGQTARKDIAAIKAMVRGSRNRISIDFHAQGLLGHALGYVVLKAQLGEIQSAWESVSR